MALILMLYESNLLSCSLFPCQILLSKNANKNSQPITCKHNIYSKQLLRNENSMAAYSHATIYTVQQ